ncbi:hypothetical protein HG536_0F00560 [Torulaspora globosa]|uniref:Cleavage/polyadenylation specificity factor A subunit N-terminal domain-containing protein n=1 Tax=Torulaspora globosa TaxID=48254 RepID=A0A7G3ZJP5_9SACH|nr:uncharacterized protein HG536_0F00560 [Torulaspora globosa]QLL33731.1 hypothetical protein HG536_0F00560 [Torulaspora globosa]
MTFENDQRFLNRRDAIWFCFGELSVIQDNDGPLSYHGIDDDVDISKRVEEDPQVILRAVLPKLYFKRCNTIEGKKPRKCLSLVLPRYRTEERKAPVLITTRNATSTSDAKPYAHLRAMEEVFDISNDPETLEDSEIEELLHQSPLEGPEGDELEKSSATTLERIYLLVTENSICRVGDVMPLFTHRGIDECQVFNLGDANPIIVVTLTTGHLYGMTINKTLEYVTLNYCLDLGSDGPWCVRRHQHAKEFMTFNGREGVCKFFEIGNQGQVQAVNNLVLDDCTILECIFFPNENDSHFFLFIAALQSNRLMYYCIEWDTSEPKVKKVHYLTYWTDHTFEACAPLSDNKILVFYVGVLEVISANQLMSGETNFNRSEAGNLRAIRDHFYAPKLLELLKRERAEEFSKFEHCLVVGALSGHINACLVDGNDQTTIYSLTRFKGLSGLCSMDERADLDNEYPLIVISYGRTIELFIDIGEMRPTTSANLVSSFSALTFKHTMDSSSEGTSEIMVVPPRKRWGRHASEIWLTSPTAITNFQTSGSLRKVYRICKLRHISFFNSARCYPLNGLQPEFRNRLSRDLGKLGQQAYIIFGTDRTPVSTAPSSTCLTLDLSTAEPQLTEVDDLMIRTDEECFEVFLTSRFLIQVSRRSIYAQSLKFGIDDEPIIYSPGWRIDGVARFEQAVIIWNDKERQMQYIEDINCIDKKEFPAINLSDDGMTGIEEGQLECQLVRGSDGKIIVYLAGNGKLIKLSPNLSGPAKAITLCSGQIKTMTCLKDWLCFIRNGGEIIAVRHSDLSMQSVDLDFQFSDIRLRKMNDCSCLVFSTQEVAVFTLADTDSFRYCFYELNLPYETNVNASIVDVQVDEVNGKVFLQRFDGLHVLEMSYYSWNRSKYILRSTRDMNKKFIFVEKINRMLVVNFDSRKWDCIKLSNGKTLSLNPSVLFEETASLVDVVEIPTEDKSVTLVLNFGKLIKLVHLLPQRGKIIVKQGHKVCFGFPILPFAAIRPDGGLYILRAEHKNETQLDEATILAVEVSETGLKFTQGLTFYIEDVRQIKEFKIYGRDIIVNHAGYNTIFLLKDIRKSMLRKQIKIIALEVDPGFSLRSLHPLNGDCFVAAVQSREPSVTLSHLLFFHRSDVELQSSLDGMPAGQQYDYFERAAAAHTAQVSSRLQNSTDAEAGEDDETDEMDEMDEIDAFARPAQPAPGVRHNDAHLGEPYSTITLAYHVKDLAYDAADQKLLVLATDDSVAVYQLDTGAEHRAAGTPASV